jgi:hypothetical protein
MKTRETIKLLDIPLLQAIILYFLLAILLYPHYQYQLNPDGISYMCIAKKYYLHDFSNAINGYWGPLLSWLMVPFLAIGFTQIQAANVVLITIGLTVIIQANSLLKALNISLINRFVSMNILSILVIYFVFYVITPDLLFVSFTLFFVLKTLDSGLKYKKYAGVVFGLIGAGLYLTKNFGFPFFMASFFTISLIFYVRSGNKSTRQKVLINYILGMFVFLLISGCWIYLLSHKYGKLTMSTTGDYNWALKGPFGHDHPMFYAGLLDPPNNTAICIWEDVSKVEYKSWSMFDSTDSFLIEIRSVIRNFLWILKFLVDFSFLSIPVCLVSLIYLFKRRKVIFDESIFYPILIVIVLYAGYSVMSVDPRFLWYGYIVIIIAGAKLLDLLFDRKNIKKIFKIVIIGIYITAFLISPINSIRNTIDVAKNDFQLSKNIKNMDVKGRIASIGDWQISYYICYFNEWKYYGISGKFDEQYLENELKNKMIDYYFVWEGDGSKLKFVEKYNEITEGTTPGLKIYKLK